MKTELFDFCRNETEKQKMEGAPILYVDLHGEKLPFKIESIEDKDTGTSIDVSEVKRYRSIWLENFGMLLSRPYVFKVSKTLTDLFRATDNKLEDEARLPFSMIFLETRLPHTAIVNGRRRVMELLGLSLYELPKNLFESTSDESFVEYKINPQIPSKIMEQLEEISIGFHGMSRDPENGSIHLISFPLNSKFLSRSEDGNLVGLSGEEKDIIYVYRNEIEKFVANFLDFLETPDVQIVEWKRPNRRNRARKERKKESSIKMVIRITGETKEYLNRYETGQRFTYSHQFMVRGHWRHFYSDRFKNMKGKKKWIFPFIKGDGILVGGKKYDVRDRNI